MESGEVDDVIYLQKEGGTLNKWSEKTVASRIGNVMIPARNVERCATTIEEHHLIGGLSAGRLLPTTSECGLLHQTWRNR
jgi:hypothetical protein